MALRSEKYVVYRQLATPEPRNFSEFGSIPKESGIYKLFSAKMSACNLNMI